MTGSVEDPFYAGLVVFIVNFAVNIFDKKPFYDRVLDGMEKAHNVGKEVKVCYFELKVSHSAFVIGKSVRDVMWPHASVIVSINRDHRDFSDTDNDGEKKLYAGDTLVLRARCYDEEEMKTYLYDLVGREYPITVSL